jgi:hypothetical protein
VDQEGQERTGHPRHRRWGDANPRTPTAPTPMDGGTRVVEQGQGHWLASQESSLHAPCWCNAVRHSRMVRRQTVRGLLSIGIGTVRIGAFQEGSSARLADGPSSDILPLHGLRILQGTNSSKLCFRARLSEGRTLRSEETGIIYLTQGVMTTWDEKTLREQEITHLGDVPAPIRVYATSIIRRGARNRPPPHCEWG